MSSRFLFIACLLVVLGCARLGAQDRHYFALVIGIRGYPAFKQGNRLQFADADARDFHAFIRSPEGGAFPEENVVMLLNENATRSAILDSITSLGRRIGHNDIVYVFFSGHGETDAFDDSYLMPYNADPDHPRDLGIPAGDFVAQIRNEFEAQYILFFIDACYAGGSVVTSLGKSKGADIAGALRESLDQGLASSSSTVAMGLVSASTNEQSWEDPTHAHGLFSWYLLEGLRGAADDPPGGDGNNEVSAAELYSYVLANVERDSRVRFKYQSPQKGGKWNGLLPVAFRRGTPAPFSQIVGHAANLDSLFRLAYDTTEAGWYTQGIRLYEQVLALDPHHSAAHNNLGAAFVRAGDDSDAVAQFRQAISYDSKNALAFRNLGHMLTRAGHTEAALDTLRLAIRFNPGYANAHDDIGLALRDIGDLDSALIEIREAARLDSSRSIYYQHIGSTLEQIGDLDGAVEAYRRAVKLAADTLWRQDLARALTRQADRDRKIQEARQTYQADPSKYRTLAFLLHEEAFRFEETFRIDSGALRASPNDPPTQADYAEALFTSGRFFETDAYIAGLLAISTMPSRIQIVLRTIQIANLEALGRADQAKSHADQLAALVLTQPDTFRIGPTRGWVFTGTKYFIRNDTRFGPYQGWLLGVFRAFERGPRDTILAYLQTPTVRADLEWVRCQGNVWCDLNAVNLQSPHFNGMEGVYVVWSGGTSPQVLRVGEGVIRSEIEKLRLDVAVQRRSAAGLHVTWARVPAAQRAGIEQYLADRLHPLYGERSLSQRPLEAKLPW